MKLDDSNNKVNAVENKILEVWDVHNLQLTSLSENLLFDCGQILQ